MLRDQVRHSKKTSRRTASKKVVRRRRELSSTPAPTKHRFFSYIVIPLLLLGSLWYGFNHILSYLTLVSSSRLTLLIGSPTPPMPVGRVWLLAEGQHSTPRYFSLSTESELTSGMTPGLYWSEVALVLSTAESLDMSRLVVSQSLGLSIDNVINLATTEDDWDAVKGELRQTALASIRSGALTNDSIHHWLVARMSEGSDESQTAESIVANLDRQNLSAITSKENCPVAVLNNSGKPGFASLVGQIIEQNGGTVLRIANALSLGESTAVAQTETRLITRPAEAGRCVETIKTVRTLLPGLKLGEDEVLADQYRASAILILGQDAATGAVPDPRQ